MRKIVFVIEDRCTGGFTSSLSSLYNAIKKQYDISVLQLAQMGDAEVSYKDVLIKPWWLCDFFYSDYTLSKGIRKLFVGIVHFWALIDKELPQRITNHYTELFKSSDCVIAFGEGFATHFTRYIEVSRKVSWIHNEVTHYPRSQENLEEYLKFDNIVCVAYTIADKMKNLYPEISNRIIGIHNIVDEKRIKQLSQEPISEFFPNSINIISLGRITEVKRFSLIPAIAKQLKGKGLIFKWWILGPIADNEVFEKLRNAIKSQDISDCVEWIGNRKNPYPYIAKSDILVSTSSTEACPMVFAEARILNTPIVSADFMTASEFVDNGVDGLISTVEKIADTIMRLTDKTLFDEIKQKSALRGSGNIETIERFSKLVSE